MECSHHRQGLNVLCHGLAPGIVLSYLSVRVVRKKSMLVFECVSVLFFRNLIFFLCKYDLYKKIPTFMFKTDYILMRDVFLRESCKKELRFIKMNLNVK